MNRNVALLPAIVLCGCAPNPAVEAAAAADLVSMVQESVGEYSGVETTYVAVNLTERSIYPKAITHGSFVKSNGCVAFRPVTGTLLTPIFPHGTRLASNANGNFDLVIEASRVSFGREYFVGGGVVPLPSEGIALAAPVPATCSASYYLVGSVNERG
ncbi:MAG TPA: hypothetical protein VMN38_09970 [Sphingomicrobium sp.]|nr:hypothetical protein [Sphingomicrobium sp.]